MGSVTADSWKCWVNKPVQSSAKWEQWGDSVSWHSLLRASFDLIRSAAWRGTGLSHWIPQFKWSPYYPLTLMPRVGGLATICERVANQALSRHPVLAKIPRDRLYLGGLIIHSVKRYFIYIVNTPDFRHYFLLNRDFNGFFSIHYSTIALVSMPFVSLCLWMSHNIF